MWSAPRGQKQLNNLAAKGGWFLHLGSEELMGKLMGKPGNNPQFETKPLVILSHVQPWITSNLGLWLVKTECLMVVRLLPKYRQQSHTAPRLCFVKFSCLMVALVALNSLNSLNTCHISHIISPSHPTSAHLAEIRLKPLYRSESSLLRWRRAACKALQGALEVGPIIKILVWRFW
jgi:hypothetical protein